MRYRVYRNYLALKWLEVFSDRTYLEEKKKRIKFYQQFAKGKSDLFIDVGANIGNRTEAFLALSDRVVSIEPQSFCAKILKLRFGNRMRLLRMGLAAREGEAEIHVSDSHTLSSFSREWIEKAGQGRFKNEQWSRTENVPLQTLDNVIKDFGRPRFIKIDVEGYEKEILTSLTEKFDYLSFEVNLPENFKDTVMILNYLNRQFDVSFNFSRGESMQLEQNKWLRLVDFMKKYRDLFEHKGCFGDVYVKNNEN